jgi:hypothetical protein
MKEVIEILGYNNVHSLADLSAFQFMQIIVIGYSGLVILWVLFSFSFEIKNKFNSPKAKMDMFRVMNVLHGKTTILLPFRILSIVAMVSWLILAMPWMGVFTGIHLYSSIDGATLITPFGEFAGKMGDYYFTTIFLGIAGVKGFFVVKRMADILAHDHLAVTSFGEWGGRKEMI